MNIGCQEKKEENYYYFMNNLRNLKYATIDCELWFFVEDYRYAVYGGSINHPTQYEQR